MFDIPVVLFLFKRSNTLEKIIERLRKVKPQKIYLLADGARNEEEINEIIKCRNLAEHLIDWECQIIKNYAEKNKGVIENIGNGAKWVLKQEPWAIFLEDDNLPEVSFFKFCKEMLIKYKDDNRIMWVCGTNYLGKYDTEYSYMFTRHLLPCGWASWSQKFLENYDIYLDTLKSDKKLNIFYNTYTSKRLLEQQIYSIKRTKYLIDKNKSKASWDYQMLFSIRSNNLFGISPSVNLIKNIGVDNYSIHGGNTFKNKMVQRFCGMNSYELIFPLKHPHKVEIDLVYEKKIGKILLMPIKERIQRKIATMIKPILGLNPYDSFREYISKNKMRRNF
jgi:hypothetical protein